ncbi:helicase-associated domain-containing protein [Cohnella sp. GCM10027633]|uniref:helicase-associated domain-containing protein n=1 Tax=unclassified Cohnella TaxID=2636738 RepID=UPI003641E098
MNVRDSVAKLPEPIYGLIAASPCVREHLDAGVGLADVLRSRGWASRLSASADADTVRLLRAIVLRYASAPFECEQLQKALSPDGFTGAEVRVGIAKLRRDGALFAVRKAWGDRMYYVPTDAVPVWQPLLLPVAVDPLPMDSERRPIASDKSYRLSLSLELLLAWHSLRNRPIGFTGKGALNRAAIAKLVQPMRLKPEELEPLAFAYPDAEHLPRQAAFAIDMGLCAGVLLRADDSIRIDERGLRNWLALSVGEADARLHEVLLERYASANARLHLVASACARLPGETWLAERVFAPLAPEREVGAWLGLLESFGWLERSEAAGEAVFRKRPEYPFGEEDSLIQRETEEGIFIVQPDGEVIVTPEVGLAARWTLELAAERCVADTLFVYRLTRRACAEAYDAGLTLQAMIEFLEQGSADRLPEQVADALMDWYGRLGMAKLEEALLLRAATPEHAKLLREDPELSALKLEQVGDRDFIVEASARRTVEARMAKLGYPLSKRGGGDAVPSADASDGTASVAAGNREDPGWIYRPHSLRHYDTEPSIPELEELFPGVSDIPAAWLREPRPYHASTREALFRRAIDWQASVLVKQEGRARQFVPSAVERAGPDWNAIGHWREECGCNPEPAKIGGGTFAEVMIVLPRMDEDATN